MAVRPMKVWNAATSTWDDVAVSQRGDVVNKTDFAAKGDIIAGTGASAYDNLPAGNNGEVLTADSTTASGLRWQTAYNAGRNRIINGGFDVWQRGTSFTNPADGAYTADRWLVSYNGSGATRTISRQAFAPGNAITGYEPAFFFRYNVSVGGTGGTYHSTQQYIEDVRTFAGQTIAVSFWAKAEASRTTTVAFRQEFGSGGSSPVFLTGQSISLTTSWQRFTLTFSIDSISGKTVGAGSYLAFIINCPLNAISTTDVWGVQIEAGNVATRFEEEPFEATLRKCQRYYYRIEPGALTAQFGFGWAYATNGSVQMVHFPTTMRTAPSGLEGSGTSGHYEIAYLGFATPVTAGPFFNTATRDGAVITVNTASVLTGGVGTNLRVLNTGAYLAWSAEL